MQESLTCPRPRSDELGGPILAEPRAGLVQKYMFFQMFSDRIFPDEPVLGRFLTIFCDPHTELKPETLLSKTAQADEENPATEVFCPCHAPGLMVVRIPIHGFIFNSNSASVMIEAHCSCIEMDRL
ncbi:MAG: hypothetical protein AB7T27_03100 [Kiritimatiellia bacterium]